MTTFHKILGQGVAVALLLLSGITGVYGQVPGAGLGSFGGELRGASLIEGKVVCVGCRVDEVQKAHPELAPLYLLQHGQHQAVLAVTKVSDPQWWDTIVFPHQLRVRSKDEVFAELTAEKNLFKKVEISGLLRKDRVLDVSSVTIIE